MNKKFKDEFSNISISDELERKIFNKTVNKEKSKNFTKLAYISLSTIIVCALSLSLVYAKEIKQIFQNWSSSISFENGSKETIIENSLFKKIPTNVKKTKDGESAIEMTEDEIENMLNFKILVYDKATTKNMYYTTGLNENGEVGRIDIWYPGFINENEEKNVFLFISMLNENADKGYVYAFQEGLDASGERKLKNTYVSNNLGVKVIICSSDWSNERLTATFCYDDILYEMIGENVTEQELKEIIEQLH